LPGHWGGGKDQVHHDSDFINDQGAGAPTMIVVEFEEEFDLIIPDQAAERIQTVGQAIEHVRKVVRENSQTCS